MVAGHCRNLKNATNLDNISLYKIKLDRSTKDCHQLQNTEQSVDSRLRLTVALSRLQSAAIGSVTFFHTPAPCGYGRTHEAHKRPSTGKILF